MLAAVTKKTAPVTVETPPDADDTIGAVLTPELKLAAYFDSIGPEAGISIGVYQIDPANRSRKGFLFYFEADELTAHDLFARCLEDWGPGEYEAIAQDGGAIAFSQRFVLGSIKKERTSISAPPSAGRNFQQPAATGTDPALLALLESHQRTLDQLVAAQADRPSTLDTLKELRELQALTTPAPAAGNGLGNVLEIVQSVLALKNELGGDDAATDPLTQMVKTLGPAIVDAVGALQTHRPIAGAIETPSVAPTRGLPEVNTQGAGRLIGPYLPTILANARGGVLPQDAARQILEQLAALPNETLAALLDYLDDDQAVDKLAAMDAEVIQLREWFDQLVDTLCVSLKDKLGIVDEPAELDIDPDDDPGPVPLGGGAGREVGDWPIVDVDSGAASVVQQAETDAADTQSGADKP